MRMKAIPDCSSVRSGRIIHDVSDKGASTLGILIPCDFGNGDFGERVPMMGVFAGRERHLPVEGGIPLTHTHRLIVPFQQPTTEWNALRIDVGGG